MPVACSIASSTESTLSRSLTTTALPVPMRKSSDRSSMTPPLSSETPSSRISGASSVTSPSINLPSPITTSSPATLSPSTTSRTGTLSLLRLETPFLLGAATGLTFSVSSTFFSIVLGRFLVPCKTSLSSTLALPWEDAFSESAILRYCSSVAFLRKLLNSHNVSRSPAMAKAV